MGFVIFLGGSIFINHPSKETEMFKMSAASNGVVLGSQYLDTPSFSPTAAVALPLMWA